MAAKRIQTENLEVGAIERSGRVRSQNRGALPAFCSAEVAGAHSVVWVPNLTAFVDFKPSR